MWLDENMAFSTRHDFPKRHTLVLPVTGNSGITGRTCKAAKPARCGIPETQWKNTILSRLSAGEIERLSLSPVEFNVGHEIEYPGNPIRNVFFVEEGMASMTTTFTDGAQVEVGMFGYESIIGVSALMGTKRSLNRVYTQVEGRGYCSPVEIARAEFGRGGLFQNMALRYVQAQLIQAAQSAGCNAKHPLEQRLARWLLITADRVHKPSFLMSQEFLADMVGNTRSTVSRAAGQLKEEGLIDYSRGLISILDFPGLENARASATRSSNGTSKITPPSRTIKPSRKRIALCATGYRRGMGDSLSWFCKAFLFVLLRDV